MISRTGILLLSTCTVFLIFRCAFQFIPLYGLPQDTKPSWLEQGAYMTYQQLFEWEGKNETAYMKWNVTEIQGDFIDLYVISHGANLTDGDVTLTTGEADLLINATSRVVINCSDPNYIGEKWPFWIETNVTLGSPIDIWYGTNAISHEEPIHVFGQQIDCWVVEYNWATATMIRWYDKSSGIVLKIRVTLERQNITVTTTETAVLTSVSLYHRVHNLYTGFRFATIQEAISAPETVNGHTIFVEEGIYYEHLVVNKAVSLVGQAEYLTIIDGNLTQDVVRITHDNVTITGFTIQRSGRIASNAAVSLSTKHCSIFGNRIVDNEIGIYGAPKNTSIANNTITNNHVGVAIDPGATYNTISKNRLMANNVSINLYYAHANRTFENNITNNWRSITLGYSSNNRFYHNCFLNNTEPILIFPDSYANFWDDGYPSGGNYWSDHLDVDLCSGPYQNETGSDGIWDHPYAIDENNTDNYPLIPEFPSLILLLLMLTISLATVIYKERATVDAMI